YAVLARLRVGPVRAVADPVAAAPASARGGGESGAERLLDLRADLRALGGLTRAGAAAAHARFRGLERESAEHRAAAVTLQGRDRLVEMRADERAPIARRAPHAVVDLAASVGRLGALPGRIDPTAGHPLLHDRVRAGEPLAVGHDGRHRATAAEESRFPAHREGRRLLTGHGHAPDPRHGRA